MAIKEQITIEVQETGMDDAIRKSNELAKATDSVTESEEKKQKGLRGSANAVLENGGAMGLLNDATGGYAMIVKDAVEASELFNVVEAKAAVQKKLSAASTYALSAAQTAYTFVVGASTGAMKAFRIALASTGIGLIVIAIVLLIANFGKIKDAVMNLFPPLKILGAIFGGFIDMMTDFIGVTSEASRELDKLAAKANENAKANELRLESEGDLYDKYTLRKLKAEQDLKKKIDEIAKIDPEELSDEGKLKAIKDAQLRFARDLKAIDKEAADESKKIEDDRQSAISKKMDDFRRKQEDAAAKDNMQKIALEQKRAIEEINQMNASEAEKKKLRDAAIAVFDSQRAAERKKINEDYEKQRKDAEEKNKQRLDSIAKILEDYKRREEDLAARTAAEKLKLEEDRALAELNLYKATEADKLVVQQFYARRQNEEAEKAAEEARQLEKDKQKSLRDLEADQQQWEIDKQQREIDSETDPQKKFEKQLQLFEDQRIAMKEQADFEMENLQATIDNDKLSLKERADAEAQYAMVKQNLEQSLADQDEQIATAKKERAESEKQNRINIATSTATMLADLAGKGGELAKGMAASQAIQDTYAGATAAYKSLSGIPIVGPALGAAAAGVAIASGLMNVKKILATKPVEKSAPGGGASAGAVPSAPAFNLVQGTGANQIAEAVAGNNTPIQAYVVSNNVTTAQSLERNIVDDSRI